jgi:5-bromo-4-chloroindolyl phosphate hydrolysis protein
MADSPVIVAESNVLKQLLTDVVRRELQDSAPDALREALKSKWLHRDEVKDQYGLTDRQLQYLRDNEEVTYSQRGRRIWYLRESVEEYFNEGRVDAKR